MDFLYSTGAVALYQHLGPAHHHLPRPVFGLCWNAPGLSNQLLARRHHSYLRTYLLEIRNARCRRVARSPGSPITYEVWTGQRTWFCYVANPQRNCGAIGAGRNQGGSNPRGPFVDQRDVSARRARVVATQLTGDAAAIEKSNLNPTAS